MSFKLKNIITKYSIVFSIFIFITACNNKSASNDYTYFGGKIINPKSDIIYFIKNGTILDSTYLDADNHFSFKFKDLKEGLFSFKSGYESQYLFLKPNDSLLLRLNSWAFDESLVFSGKGSEKNNFLINLFLRNEKNDKEFYSFYKLNENDFQKKIDSALNTKYALLKQYKEEKPPTSKQFNKLVSVAIKYPLYRMKEVYPYFHRMRNNLNHFERVSDSFYNYRKKIDLNDASLAHFYPYYNYINSYLYHLAYVKKLNDSTKNNLTLNLFEAINKNIHQNKIKNYFLNKAIRNSFFNNNSPKDLQIALSIFYKNCTDLTIKNDIKELEKDFKTIKKNTPLPNFKIVDINGKKTRIRNIVKNKNTIIYFWSQNLFSENYLANRINHLKNNYKNLLFIGINTQNSYNKWRSSTLFRKLNIRNQYKLANNSNIRKFMTSNTPRVILVDHNLTVQNGFTVFWAQNFNKQLLNLEKK